MLVLSRKLGERIYVDDDVCIVVTYIDQGRIRLGIEAPRDKVISRGELLSADERRAVADRAAKRV